MPPDNRVNAIHAVLMNDGKVLLIAGSGNKEDMFATKALKSMVYDPATGQSKMIPVPDDMFCGGQTVLPDGRVLFAGGTQRYEKLDGAVTNAAGAMRIKNENPTAPRFLPAGTEFVSPGGQKYRSDFDTTVPPAAKTGTGAADQGHRVRGEGLRRGRAGRPAGGRRQPRQVLHRRSEPGRREEPLRARRADDPGQAGLPGHRQGLHVRPEDRAVDRDPEHEPGPLVPDA